MRVVGRRTLGATVALGALAGGLAFGTGIASADTPTCTGEDGLLYTGLASDITGPICDQALIDSKVLTRYTPPADSSTPSVPDTTSGAGATAGGDTTPGGTTAGGTVSGGGAAAGGTVTGGGAVSGGGAPAGGTQSNSGPQNGSPTATNPSLLPGPTPPALAAGPVAPVLPAGTVLAAAPAAGVLPTDLTGTPLEPSLIASGVYDPALLLAPGNAPLVRATTNNPASAVTTASQVQAMAVNLPAGVGLPALVGVVILAGLGGLALRHRLSRRMKKSVAS